MPSWKITGITPEGDPLELYADGDWEDVADYMDCLRDVGAQDLSCVEATTIPSRFDEVIYLTPPEKLYRRNDKDLPR